jgi:hypothetical protein
MEEIRAYGDYDLGEPGDEDARIEGAILVGCHELLTLYQQHHRITAVDLSLRKSPSALELGLGRALTDDLRRSAHGHERPQSRPSEPG